MKDSGSRPKHWFSQFVSSVLNSSQQIDKGNIPTKKIFLPSVNNASLSTRPKDSLKSTFLFKKCAFFSQYSILQLRPEMDILALPLTFKIYYISYFPKNLGLASCWQLRWRQARNTITSLLFVFLLIFFPFRDFCWKSSRLLSTKMPTKITKWEKMQMIRIPLKMILLFQLTTATNNKSLSNMTWTAP